MGDLILVHENRGEPDGLVVSHLPYGPSAYFGLFNVITRHEIGTRKELGPIPETCPHLIFEGFDTSLGIRVKEILKHLFPSMKEPTKRVVTFANQSDYIIFRQHLFERQTRNGIVKIAEVGPRFEMRLFKIKLG